eukprot:TRINITY_DN8449_c0_g1_i2.p1 TRINITY_DN8449_c0_g1~~TRINITY_DN8449_c0_g1_i2.p1  ORF type:complete len:372 (+),score=44.54 TRINITY_DN8449_c0_g1_i2:91-1116(+)
MHDDTTSFEGPEKKLDLFFIINEIKPSGMRDVPKERWQQILDLTSCTILSSMSNHSCDAHLLSESSLFVFPHRIILKTCGQITLLRCLEALISLAKGYCESLQSIHYSRRNLFFPDQQLTPHTSWEDECTYLRSHFPEGEAHVFGSLSCDHHYVFIADNTDLCGRVSIHPAEQILEILMTGLDRDVMKHFYSKPEFISSFQVSQNSGIVSLLSDVSLDTHQFSPCGYSLNGLKDQTYYTIHITPQLTCSYVSFETNVVCDGYKGLIERVLDTFKPSSFTVLLFSDKLHSMEVQETYKRRKMVQHKFSQYNDFNLTFSSYQRLEEPYTLHITDRFTNSIPSS